MKKNNLFIFTAILLFLMVISKNAFADQTKLDQSKRTLENRKLSNSDRENAYITLLTSNTPGFKILSDLLASGVIPTSEWVDWAYDYQSRFEEGNHNEKNFESFLYNRVENESDFAKLFAQHFADGKFKDESAFEYLKDSSAGLRRLGFLILQGRYSHLPPFDYQAGDVVRTKQLEEISAFLKSKGQ